MSPRLLRIDTSRIDAARLDAMVFRADSVRFEACATFRSESLAADGDTEVCECGWLEIDHATPVVGRRQFLGRRPRRRLQPAAARDTARAAS